MDSTKRSSDKVASAAPSDIECKALVDAEHSSSDAQEIMNAEGLDPPVYDLCLLQQSTELINCVLMSYYDAVCQLSLVRKRVSHPGLTLSVHSCSTPGKHNSYDKATYTRSCAAEGVLCRC